MTTDTERRYGWRPDKPDIRDLKLSALRPDATPLPPSADMRPLMPGVYDQGQLGSCTGNAIAGAIEYTRRRDKIGDFVPSRLFIYYNERSMEGTIASDAGAEIRDGIKSVADCGCCAERHWPYDVSQFMQRPSDDCYSMAKGDLVTTYARVGQTEDALRACLAGGFPVVFGFTVYASFESQEVARTGLMPMPGPREKALGGHAVLMCGYHDDRRLFLVRNSWGSKWGEKGYFWMPYDYPTNTDLAADFWVINAVGAAA